MRQRSPYQRVRIESINRSELIKDEEDRWRLLTPMGNYLYRVWIMGIITEKKKLGDNLISLSVEDGSGIINVNSAKNSMDMFHQWDKIEVLGYIQFSEGENEIEVYLEPDIVQRVSDDNWYLVHRLKIVKQNQNRANSDFKPAKVRGIELTGRISIEDLKTKLKELVKTYDTGKGVTLEQLAAKLPNIDEAQIFEAITELLEAGEFFEPKVGIYSSAFDS